MLRTTYTRVDKPFPPHRANTIEQVATKIIVHRQGNPGVEGESGINWMIRTGAASIHRYIDDARVCFGVPLNRHAFHVLQSGRARLFGLLDKGAYGYRGDYGTIGVECEDENRQSADLAPGQEYGLSQETRISLVLVLRDLCRETKLGPMDILFHSDLDPWTRPLDLGNALNLADLRADVADILAGREPWRTVQKYATGARAPETWRPVVEEPPLTLTEWVDAVYVPSTVPGRPPWNRWVRTVDRGSAYEDVTYEMTVRRKKK